MERLALIIMMGIMVSGCSSTLFDRTPAHKNSNTAPYKITNSQMKNRWFYPQKHYEYSEVGYASHYGGGDNTHGRLTASGEMFDNNRLTAAHRTLPIPSIVRVTNLENGKSVIVKVNDRGPFHSTHKRIIDVSDRAARILGFHKHGLTKVRVSTLVNESIRVAQNHGTYRDNLIKSHHKRQRLVKKQNKKRKRSRYASLPKSYYHNRKSSRYLINKKRYQPRKRSLQMAHSGKIIMPKLSPFRRYQTR